MVSVHIIYSTFLQIIVVKLLVLPNYESKLVNFVGLNYKFIFGLD